MERWRATEKQKEYILFMYEFSFYLLPYPFDLENMTKGEASDCIKKNYVISHENVTHLLLVIEV